MRAERHVTKGQQVSHLEPSQPSPRGHRLRGPARPRRSSALLRRQRRRADTRRSGRAEDSAQRRFPGGADRPLSGPAAGQASWRSTYPLEIIQLQQWLEKNKNLKDKALADAVEKQPWDPSIQAMAALPDVVKRLGDDIQWTTDLGNAFLAQQSDVMDAVQRMRKKAEGQGHLKIDRAAEGRDQGRRKQAGDRGRAGEPAGRLRADLQPGRRLRPAGLSLSADLLSAAAALRRGSRISFGVGMMVGAAWERRLGLGLRLGRDNDVNINVNNNFNRNTTSTATPTSTGAAAIRWQHNPQHRGGAPYSNQATANKYGGTARGDSLVQPAAPDAGAAGQPAGRRSRSETPCGVSSSRSAAEAAAATASADRDISSGRAATGAQ